MKFVSIIWSSLIKEEKQKVLVLFLLMLVGMGLEMIGIGLMVPLLLSMSGESGLFEDLPVILKDASLIRVIVLITVVYLFKNGILASILWFQNGFLTTLKARMSQQLFGTYLNKPFSFHLDNNSAPLIRNAFFEVGTIIGAGIQPVLYLIAEGLVVFGVLSVLFWINPESMFIAGGMVLIMAVFAYVGTRKFLYKLGAEKALNEGNRLSHLQQGIAAVMEIKLSGKEQEFIRRYARWDNASAKVFRVHSTFQNLPRIWFEVVFIITLAILVLCWDARGMHQAEIFSTMILLAAAAFRLLPSATRILSALNNIQFGLPIVELLHEDLKSENQYAKGVLIFENGIVFKNVSFRYSRDSPMILNAVSFKIKKNEAVGVIGISGQGKSTLVNIMAGLLSPTSGEVHIDSKPIKNLEASWCRHIGYVPQQVYLLDDTIKRNVAFGIPDGDIDESRVWAVLKKSGIEDDVKGMPDGIETEVGERGARVSGGQKQRLGIARALYREPALLILDESTSSLDVKTESGILETLSGLKGQITMVIVSHRQSAIQECDRVLRVLNGSVSKSEL
jgi:ATP-binding cassette, subfamily B, bacterial PglK